MNGGRSELRINIAIQDNQPRFSERQLPTNESLQNRIVARPILTWWAIEVGIPGGLHLGSPRAVRGIPARRPPSEPGAAGPKPRRLPSMGCEGLSPFSLLSTRFPHPAVIYRRFLFITPIRAIHWRVPYLETGLCAHSLRASPQMIQGHFAKARGRWHHMCLFLQTTAQVKFCFGVHSTALQQSMYIYHAHTGNYPVVHRNLDGHCKFHYHLTK